MRLKSLALASQPILGVPCNYFGKHVYDIGTHKHLLAVCVEFLDLKYNKVLERFLNDDTLIKFVFASNWCMHLLWAKQCICGYHCCFTRGSIPPGKDNPGLTVWSSPTVCVGFIWVLCFLWIIQQALLRGPSVNTWW